MRLRKFSRRVAGSIFAKRNRTKTLHYAPKDEQNPFQAMLYSTLDKHKIEIQAVPNSKSKLNQYLLDLSSLDDPGVFHLHWTYEILQPKATETEAKQALDDFSAALSQFSDAGGRLIWSVHNVLSHDTKYPELEIELARRLARHASVVHLLSEETKTLVEEYYDLDPSRCVVIGHSSYTGQYPNSMTRSQARLNLGISETDTALLVFGQVRPYKGIDRLITSLDRIKPLTGKLRLLIAGRMHVSALSDELIQICESDDRIIADFRNIPPEEVQVWMNASDIAVLPYTKILNSGFFWLATTFGLPIVAPNLGTLATYSTSEHVIVYDGDSDSALVGAVNLAIERFTAPAGRAAGRKAALEFAKLHSPEKMADTFAKAVLPLWHKR